MDSREVGKCQGDRFFPGGTSGAAENIESSLLFRMAELARKSGLEKIMLGRVVCLTDRRPDPTHAFLLRLQGR
jgi:hypothetical protein